MYYQDTAVDANRKKYWRGNAKAVVEPSAER